jgi:uncharacterized Fe-S radical SAM superfamily protein PflX
MAWSIRGEYFDKTGKSGHFREFNLMAQYYAGKVGQDGQYEEIAGRLHRGEYEQALAVALELGLRLDARSTADRRRLPLAS